jgi:pimeloyl-ACP methyl ester carboxylesterase
MADPTRPLPNLVPQADGSWTGRTVLTPTAFTTRGRFTLPPSKVIPVIVVPGIMASNLRAATSPAKRANKALGPGEAAWRAPNGKFEGLKTARKWKHLTPATRQDLLHPDTVEVDDRGDIHLPLEARSYGLSEAEVRERDWGEVHWDSYGSLLYGLHVNLNHTFYMDPLDNVRTICRHWKDVMGCDPARWGVRNIDRITEAELEKHARFHFPVYACGYNWLASCSDSAGLLRRKIERVIAFWNERRRECGKVILVTHSMGGLVARACAKQIPDQILGVIHGVMPALGAPACYRRIACGTENWSPSNGVVANKTAEAIADILGATPAATMPVMATAPGALELLPNHLYPKPWIHVHTVSTINHREVTRDIVHLPSGDPYDFYRDMQSWYRLVDPLLLDPAHRYRDEEAAKEAVRQAIARAERFHREILGTYYHPNTHVFYGSDPAQLSFGAVHWVARDPADGAVFTEANLRGGAMAGYAPGGGRRVRVEGHSSLLFVPARQDAAGDGTVPHQSGSGPRAQVQQSFEVRGFDHQEAYQHEAVQMLTQHLIAKLVQKMP